jgi:hypothetical protein
MSEANTGPDCVVEVVCGACEDAPRLATVKWHSRSPERGLAIFPEDGLAAVHLEVGVGETGYTFKCGADRDCSNTATLTKEELRERSAAAWDTRQGARAVLKV